MPRRAVAALALCACSSSLPEPARTAHPPSAYNEVPYPPPAALSEAIPEQPENVDAVWIDGEWVFRGGFYVWERGGWVAEPSSARYAAWHARYLPDGRLMLARGRWYDDGGRRVRRPEIVQPATTPSNEVTSEFQTAR